MMQNKHIHKHNIGQDAIHNRGLWLDSEEEGITHGCRDHGNVLKGSFVWDMSWHVGRFFKVKHTKEKEVFVWTLWCKKSMCKSTKLNDYVSCS